MNKLLPLLFLSIVQNSYAQYTWIADDVHCLNGYKAINIYPIGGALFTLGTVNGDKAGYYLLDSGASYTVIDDNDADALGLKLDHYTGANVRTLESSGTDVSGFCTSVIHHFILADMDSLISLKGNLDVLVTDISTLSKELPIRFSGILGLNFFQEFNVIIDFRAEKMYVKVK